MEATAATATVTAPWGPPPLRLPTARPRLRQGQGQGEIQLAVVHPAVVHPAAVHPAAVEAVVAQLVAALREVVEVVVDGRQRVVVPWQRVVVLRQRVVVPWVVVPQSVGPRGAVGPAAAGQRGVALVGVGGRQAGVDHWTGADHWQRQR